MAMRSMAIVNTTRVTRHHSGRGWEELEHRPRRFARYCLIFCAAAGRRSGPRHRCLLNAASTRIIRRLPVHSQTLMALPKYAMQRCRRRSLFALILHCSAGVSAFISRQRQIWAVGFACDRDSRPPYSVWSSSTHRPKQYRFSAFARAQEMMGCRFTSLLRRGFKAKAPPRHLMVRLPTAAAGPVVARYSIADVRTRASRASMK